MRSCGYSNYGSGRVESLLDKNRRECFKISQHMSKVQFVFPKGATDEERRRVYQDYIRREMPMDREEARKGLYRCREGPMSEAALREVQRVNDLYEKQQELALASSLESVKLLD